MEDIEDAEVLELFAADAERTFRLAGLTNKILQFVRVLDVRRFTRLRVHQGVSFRFVFALTCAGIPVFHGACHVSHMFVSFRFMRLRDF